MEIIYKRDMKHNYMIIIPEEALRDCYEEHMLAANCIDGLLKFHVKQADNRRTYYYEITSKQPLARLLDFQSLGARELGALMRGIARLLERLEEYLLQECQIWLEADYIYIEPEYFTAYFCLIPGRQGSFPEEMTALLQYLLGKVNHQDKACVVMAYGMYQESLKENYGMEDLLRLSGREGEAKVLPDGGLTGAALEESGKREEYKKNPVGNGEGYEAEGQGDNRKEKSGRKQALARGYKEDYGEGGRRIKINGIFRNLTITCMVLMGGPALGFLIRGEEWVRTHWYLLLLVDAAAVMFSAAGIYRTVWKKEPQEKGDLRPSFYEAEADGQENDRAGGSWRLMLLKADETEEDSQTDRLKGTENETAAGAWGTVLLTETNESFGVVRRLKSMKEDTEDIVIAYVPFIIGKQEGLADCILAGDAVSRLHARIDRNGEDYLITDLNSANGTMAGGRMLETNETAVLLPGDEVYIANIGFVFT